MPSETVITRKVVAESNGTLPEPDISHLVIDDEAPVDNIVSEKQMRLLTEPLYASWDGPGSQRPFVAFADVAIYYDIALPPIVPDVMLSLDVTFGQPITDKKHLSYFVWEFGKPPDLAIEILSPTKGGELTSKLAIYQRANVRFYVVFDPLGTTIPAKIRAFALHGDGYLPLNRPWFPALGLGLRRWAGVYEQLDGDWMRWCRDDGSLIPTGAERATQERERADHERERAERLAAKLRALGIDPDA
jgi:Uma2 family endonuclease